MVLKSKSELTKAMNHEELSVWLSTTMIQALRNMIALFTHYFESLEYMLDRFLDLLSLCICQENDTIARIGSNCLQQLILQNVIKFDGHHWTRIVDAFVQLFEQTTAHRLFSAATASTASMMSPVNGEMTPRPGAPYEGRPWSNSVSSGTSTDEASTDKDKTRLGADGLSSSASASQPEPSQSPPPPSLPSSTAPGESSQQSSPPPAQPNTSSSNGNDTNNPSELEDYRPPSELQQQPVVVTAARRRFFNKIINKCVLQLLMIETVQELFSNDAVYAQIPSGELLRLMAVLRNSFLFARRFNGDKELRMRLWKEGFMKQPPNLLKQESGSAATYVSMLLRMYHDDGEERRRSRAETEAALIP
jgi:brefeldin A-inhibited guanine nucleotide-exchange protein